MKSVSGVTYIHELFKTTSLLTYICLHFHDHKVGKEVRNTIVPNVLFQRFILLVSVFWAHKQNKISKTDVNLGGQGLDGV